MRLLKHHGIEHLPVRLSVTRLRSGALYGDDGSLMTSFHWTDLRHCMFTTLQRIQYTTRSSHWQNWFIRYEITKKAFTVCIYACLNVQEAQLLLWGGSTVRRSRDQQMVFVSCERAYEISYWWSIGNLTISRRFWDTTSFPLKNAHFLYPPSLNLKFENASLALNHWNSAGAEPTHQANYSCKKFSGIRPTVMPQYIHDKRQTDRHNTSYRRARP